MTTFNRKPLSLALLAAFSVGYYGMASGALLSLSQIPLFVTTAQKANVLLILDNSNSMDEDASGAAAPCVSTLCGSASPLSKSEIARNAAKSIVTDYTGKINLGLMAYQQYTSGGNAVSLKQLHNSPYDVSYDPANWNEDYTGSRDSLTKRYRIPNPTSAGNYIHYNVALPFYAGSNQGNGFCYTQTANFDNGSETYPGGPWDSYRCYNTKTGTSDTLPAANDTAAAAQGYTGNFYNGQLSPTDSDLAQGILDFGRFLTWSHIGPTWFSNSNPGRGYLHVPVGNLDAAKATAINTKLGTSQFVTNGPINATLPLQNAGLTPIEGTFLTAKDYFAGNLTATAQGGSQPAPPNGCGKDFVVFMTDGLPSISATGTALTNPTTAVAAAAAEAGNLYTATRPVKSYIVGFALPYGTTPGILDTIATAGGTGTAIEASDTTTLNSAFDTIFSDILAQSGSAAAVALTSGSVVAGGKIYQGQFNSSDWSGDLVAYNTNPTTGAITGVAWNAGTELNTQNYDTGRKILTYKSSTAAGIPFRWPADPADPAATELDASQVTALTTNPNLDLTNVNDTGANRLNFLRGQTGIAGFRARLISVLGDLVNSAPAYVGAPAFNYPDDLEAASYNSFRSTQSSRTPMLYVGANDGMLHGFDAATGLEKLAYVPSKVYPNLSQLTSPSYAHRYYVDGSPTVVDAFYSGAWHTMLVASLGAGGQGLFALDVTNPGTFSEANASSIVKWEYSDADLGYVNGQPSIVKLNTGAWAAVFSNGYNNSEADGSPSETGYAYLYIVDIATGALIKKISTNIGSDATPNALATPTLIDIDGDGDVDYAYAGDLQGNVWKFDLCNAGGSGCASTATGWNVAFSGTPLFVARDSSNNPQPITSAIEVTRHFSGDGYQLYFGTGKYLESTDIAATGQQTFYSLWDKALSPSEISGRSDLQEQTITTTTTVSGKEYRRTSSNAVAWDGLTAGDKRGWFMDLPTVGERVVSEPALFANRVLFTTLIAASGVCGGGTGWLMEMDAVAGAALGGPTFDVNEDGEVNESDHLGTAGDYASGVKKTSIPSAVRLQKNPGGPGNGTLLKPISLSKNDPTAPVAAALDVDLNSMPSTQNRSSWRQIFQ
ncbi:MAG: PilC/PilY family type IV pilus protein [Thiobacillus sp.]|nr:PilC/PilY family type IV pilus protein [Thiobacillus sp.]